MKPNKSNRKQQAREQHHVAQGSGYKHTNQPLMDHRDNYPGDVTTMIAEIEQYTRHSRFPGNLEDYRDYLKSYYKDWRPIYEEAEKIISSPLYEALREPREELEDNEPTLWHVDDGTIITSVNLQTKPITTTTKW